MWSPFLFKLGNICVSIQKTRIDEPTKLVHSAQYKDGHHSDQHFVVLINVLVNVEFMVLIRSAGKEDKEEMDQNILILILKRVLNRATYLLILSINRTNGHARLS